MWPYHCGMYEEGINGKCNLCKKDLSGVQYEGDHIIPWSKNGKTEYSNLQILCSYCHNKK